MGHDNSVNWEQLEKDYVICHGDLLEGAVDMHLHVAPSLMYRKCDIAELTLRCEQFGYKAVVHKDHHMMTGPGCKIVNDHINREGKCVAIGSVCLNNTNGGLNPYAVKSAISAGCKVVWLPTVSAQNHINAVLKGTSFPKLANGIVIEEEAIKLVDEKGDCKQEIVDILHIIKEHPGVVLATGHGDCHEINKVVEKACEMDMQDQIMIDHPDLMLETPDELLKHWVDLGVWIEWVGTMFCGISRHHMWDYADMAEKIRKTGVDRTIISTDFGQLDNVDPVKGLDNVIDGLLKEGFTKEEIRTMISVNPSKVLGI